MSLPPTVSRGHPYADHMRIKPFLYVVRVSTAKIRLSFARVVYDSPAKLTWTTMEAMTSI